jgi:hypothetical protein
MPDEDEGQGGEGKGADGEVAQQLADLQAKLAATEQDMKSLKDAKVDLEQRLDDADKELLSDEFLDFKEKKGKAPSHRAGDEELDLDRASNKEITTFIEKKYKGDIDSAVKDIKGQLDLTKQQLGMMAAQFDVALAEMRHDGKDGKPSFSENQKAIFEIAKANPKWGAEACYRQFVLHSKVDADEKAEVTRKKAEEEDRAATERAGVPGSVVQGKQLSKEDAATLAYKKAFGNKEAE